MTWRFIQRITYEALTPQPNEATTLFNTSQPFVAGTMVVWVNGQRKYASLDDGFTENPPTGVTMKEVLSTGSTLEVEYEPVS